MAYKRQRKLQISEYRYYRETDKPLERRGKNKSYDPKAQASCLGPSEPTPGRRTAPRSSTHRKGSSSSCRRAQLSQGLRHLVASNRYGEKKKAKQPWVLIRSTQQAKDLHYICNIIKGRLYMWTGLQKCQNRGKSLVLSKTSIFNIFSSLAALEECRLA